MRYKADVTAGALKLPESRLIADLLLRLVDSEGWSDAILMKTSLQARNFATARRLTRLIRGRLETMGPPLWKLVRDLNIFFRDHFFGNGYCLTIRVISVDYSIPCD
jgi:hypothetical protein